MLRILRIALLILLAVILWNVKFQVFEDPQTSSDTHQMRSKPTPKPERYFRYFTDEQDPRLVESATERAQCISSGTCQWSHDGWTEFIRRHVNYTRAGEVMAKEFANWGEVMNAWYESESHANVVNQPWCLYGAARSGDIFVMHFACE